LKELNAAEHLQVEGMKKQNADLKSSLADSEEAQRKLSSKVMELQSQHEDDMAKLKSKHKERMSELQENFEELEDAKECESRKLKREVENLRKEFEETEKYRNELSSQVSLHKLKSEEDLLMLQTKSEKVKSLRKELEKLEEETDGFLKERMISSRENEALKKEVTELTEKLDDVQSQKSEKVKAMRKELEEMEENKEGLSLEKAKFSRENEALAKEILTLRENLDDLKTEISNFENGKTKLTRENAVLREGIEESEKARSKLLEEVQDVKNQNEANHENVLQLKKSLVESIAESEAKALATQTELKQASADLQAQNEELRKRLSKVKQQYDQSMTHNEELQMTSREATLVDGKLKQRIQELEKQLDSVTGDLESAATRSGDLELAQKELKQHLEENEQLHAANESMNLELEELKALKAQFEKTDLHQIYVENQTYQEQIEFGKKKLHEMNAKLKELSGSNQTLQEQVDGLRNQNEELCEEKDEVEENILVLQQKYMNAVRLAMDQEMYIKVEDPNLNKQLGRRRSGLVMPSELTDVTEDSVDISAETMAMKTQLLRLTSENELEGTKEIDDAIDDSEYSFVESDYVEEDDRTSKNVTFDLPGDGKTLQNTAETFE